MTTPDLRCEDSWEGKSGLMFRLGARADELLPPVYVISHRRHADTPTLRAFAALRDHITVVVAVEEADDYQTALPGWKVLPIPAGYRGYPIGVGRARQFVLDTAELLGQERIVLLDDDLMSVAPLYSIGNGKVSMAVRKHLPPEYTAEFNTGWLVTVAACAEEAFDRSQGVLAAPQTNNPDRHEPPAAHRWWLNRGKPPAQCQVWDVERFAERCGEMDLERFNYHGDDIAVALQIISAGGSIVQVPSMLSVYWDYETQSVLRDESSAPDLRQTEHDHLTEKYPRYVRTRTDILGRPQWHDIAWASVRNDGLVEPYQAALWSS